MRARVLAASLCDHTDMGTWVRGYVYTDTIVCTIGESIAYKNPRIVSGSAAAGSTKITLLFDASVELRTPTAVGGCQPKILSNCGWLTVNGVNQTSITVRKGGIVEVDTAASVASIGNAPYEVVYLHADWLVKSLKQTPPVLSGPHVTSLQEGWGVGGVGSPVMFIEYRISVPAWRRSSWYLFWDMLTRA